MAWARLDDRLQMSVKIRGLADDGVTGDRKKDQINASLGHFMQLLTWVSGEGSDGFVTSDIAELFGTAATTRRLLRARFGRQPLLHQLDEHGKPPKCPCLDGREWKPDYQYLIHDYLDRNPAKAEVDVKRAKDRELRNSSLKGSVRLRDRDTCRYCGVFCSFSDRVSDEGLTYDHVDPDIAGGMGNLVIACRGCNRKKGKRTPFEAGMVLLDLPTTGPVTVAGLVPGPVTGPVTGLVVTSAPAPDGADVREHDAEHGTSLPAHQRHDASPSQVLRSPGRDGDGLATGTRIPSAVEPPPSIPIGPPPPRLTGRPGNPYRRESLPFRDLHAGHPPQPGDTPAAVATLEAP